MAESQQPTGSFPLVVADDHTRAEVAGPWKTVCDIDVYATAADAIAATGCGATWTDDGHRTGSLTCGPCRLLMVATKTKGLTLPEFGALVTRTRPDCVRHDR